MPSFHAFVFFCIFGLLNSLFTDSFKDETDQTASEYYVVPLNGHFVSRSSSEARSTPSSNMDYTGSGTLSVVPTYVESHSVSRSASDDSFSIATSVGLPKPRLGNISEAYLLRHFQRYLADWVRLISKINFEYYEPSSNMISARCWRSGTPFCCAGGATSKPVSATPLRLSGCCSLPFITNH